MERIDHTSHNHPATPAARKACRKQYREAKAQQDARDVVLAANYEAAHPPFQGRAILVNFNLKTGKRCSVTFDRYGMNASLFTEAARQGWSKDRTVAQACSNAIAGVMDQYGTDSIADYRVHLVD